MKNSPTLISDQNRKIEIVDFDPNFADDILDIQAECGLSVWSKNDYTNELEREDSLFKIAQTTDKKIIGFALVRLLIGNSNTSSISYDSSEILNIAVRDSFRHKGIGQMIFKEILRDLEHKNITEIWLEVRRSNTNAIKFYKKNAFEFQFERKNYYSNPLENACVFRRLLNRENNS